jgi:hypothetical protein
VIEINTPLKIVIGVLMLFLILILFSIFQSVPRTTNSQETTSTEIIVPASADGTCFSRCGSNEECIHTCNIVIQNEAAKAKDPNLCNNIFVKKDKAECTRIVNLIMANSIADCGDDNNCKDRYYLRQALASGDKSNCDNILNSETRGVCLNA